MAKALHLRDRHWNLVILPSHGGSLQACEYDGAAVLRPGAQIERIGAPAISCCYFPMIPFSNRIENSRFRFGDATVTVAENLPGTRHAIHGHGWQASWDVDEESERRCALVYRREATSDWPWRYEGRQAFEIFGNTLRITLAVRNLAPHAMPCGLGFHPFLPAFDGARLLFEARSVWDGNVRDFPRERVPVPPHLSFATGVPISERVGTDHCFDGWERRAVVSFEDSGHSIVVEGCAATPYVVIYIPGSDYFCVEPVTHAVNAMNLADPAAAGLWTLEPMAAREITASIHVEPAR
ncbi:MAG TPA: aldose 1-epimerase [Steroidobacteraceae bacterium]|jgi:aldose 1-epimerase|nr:aldose 1-epimerase [Steroidobacteraceae bacterium]